MVNSEKLQVVVQKFDLIPSLPGVAIKLIEAVQKTEPDIREVTELISSDVALSAKILKIINSPFYGLNHKITSLNQAIKLLGLNAIENLSLSLILKTKFINKRSLVFNLTGFWKDSLVGAVAAKLISEKAEIKNVEDIFFMGLLKNIGSLTLAYLFPDQYSVVISEIEKKKISFQDAENQIFGFNHTDVGSLLTKSWGLPEIFHIPIQNHHCVEFLPENCGIDIQMRTKILQLSSLYIDLFHAENMVQDLCYIKHFINAHGFENLLDPAEIAKDIIYHTREIFPVFDLHFSDEKELEILIERASQELINISMQMVNQMLEKDRELNLLRKQANKDAMTQLHNYHAFCETLKQEISRAMRYRTPLSLVLCDIDFFKVINDNFGHLAGDQALKLIAWKLKEELRDSDFIARYGGEEFAIILPETKIVEAVYVAERLREKIKKMEIVFDSQLIQVTMSFGVASVHHTTDISFEHFVKLADDALYRSKREGRDRCTMANPN